MGTYSPNIISNSLLSIFKHNADREYLICGERRITWRDIIPRMFKISQALVNMGIQKGDKVAFMFHNTPEFIEINAGVQVAGAIPVPMNYRYIAKEIEYQATHSDAKVMIYDAIWSEQMETALEKIPAIQHVVCRGTSRLDRAIEYETFVDSGTFSDPAVATEPEDVAVMIYTGGTTGYPKGVMLTYKAHFEMFAAMGAASAARVATVDVPPERLKKMLELLPIPIRWFAGPVMQSKTLKKIMSSPRISDFMRERSYQTYTDPDKAKRRYGRTERKGMAPSMPFFHVAAYQGLIGSALTGTGCSVLLESPSFDPAKILELVEREEISMLGNVPTGWRKLVTYPDFDKYDVSSVRMTATGGGVCPPDLKKLILEKFPHAMLIDALGLTEMTPIVSFKMDGDPDSITERSVGKAIVEAKIVDEDGNEVPQGETGEICYRSESMMKGYYKEEEKTHEVMLDGWFRSGDLGYFDENGEIRTVDRKKECINTGGEKVFPLEVEEILQLHPKVETVTVIGVPDKEWGSTVRAVIQLKADEQMEEKEVTDYCRGKMAGYKIPRSAVFVDEIPISPVGKVLRQQVRDLYGQPK